MLKSIATQMENELRKHGVESEITFINGSEFSVCVDDATQYQVAKSVLSQLKTVEFESEAIDDECGNFAYYRF